MLDAERLVNDLRRAADEAANGPLPGTVVLGRPDLVGLALAWRIIAAAIEDGEYDVPAGNGEYRRGYEDGWAGAEVAIHEADR